VKLAEAAGVLATQPTSIQLRYLQTLTEIGVEKNTTIVFPIPIDIFARLLAPVAAAGDGAAKAGPAAGEISS